MAQQKKMNLMQLTFIVAVNMMGSGIIMLPTNMAKVGAISLLSWIVTAVGSMAIAWGFAQAGVFNQRAGGMAAYGEDAYGKAGYFQVFFLYFLSLAIANVAVAISAVGYLAAFIPWLSSTPIATTIGVIALLWLTTVANFGGPSITGKIGAVTVWGVILPVGIISVIGWFWFKPDVFAAAWNPKGIGLAEGMGSSIALTLWAFLGMESAAQNSAAVENPKRDVPLACMFGTLGAAVIYVLSTAVIQGIVPNAELAKSTGPFGLAYAQMFSPMVGQIVMALAVMACLGSLLGWQFTLAQTGKDAADQHMMPALFAKANSMGAPIAGMIVMGIVQTLMALMTISPDLSEQFGALVNLAVVTNVVPYIIALSSLPVILQAARVPEGKYRLNVAVMVIAIVYSIYAIWASGKDAVMGGMLVMVIGFLIWAFMASRFTVGRAAAAPAGVAVAAFALAFAAALLPSPAEAGALDRAGTTGKVTFGYRVDARPFSYRDESNNAAGYSVALCQRIAEQIKTALQRTTLTVEWVPVTLETRFADVAQGKVDLLCGADTATLERRKEVAFSIPIYPGGIGALVRKDVDRGLREVLLEGQAARPLWRGTPATVLTEKTFAVIGKTTTEKWVAGRLDTFKISARIAAVEGYEVGIRQVLDRKADAFFGDRAILMDAAKRSTAARDLMVLDRQYTYEPIALALARGDDDFRLLVDRTLSRMYGTGEFRDFYVKYFGEPDASVLTFFRYSMLPE